ncbi:putative copper-exporting P-type ATPase A [uncultured archaeon]|nr:putative copper-exporting P-type ATPase A [uncultured archaeon]
MALIVVIPFEIASLLGFHAPLWIEVPLFVAIILLFGRTVLIDGIKSIPQLRFSNINLLMTIAVIGAMYLGEFEEAAIIILLFALGEKLEEFGFEKSKQSIASLLKKQPKLALLKGHSKKVDISEVKVGDIVIVKQGEQIPLDGVIVKGRGFIDESSITGEPLAKDKAEGAIVYAATINTNGYLEIKVTKVASDSTFSKILELTKKALEEKTSSGQFIELFAKYYTPLVVVAFVLLTTVPVLVFGQTFGLWFGRAITLLVIACPCALVISTPVSIFSALGNASKKGAIIKGGKYIEELAKVKTIAFDKTRTLTTGELEVTDVIPFNGFSKEEVIACVAGMESYSEHPLAKGILTHAKETNVSLHKFTNLKFSQGKGISGDCMVCTSKHHCLGNLKFISQEHSVPKNVEGEIDKLEKEGKTVIISAEKKSVKGIVALSDTLRPESKEVIQQLKKQGIQAIILSGDNKSAVNHFSKELQIKEYYAELLPEGKVELIDKLSKGGSGTAMVGDGVNDAPALAKANVGIALGAIGSDSAIETANIVILNNDLSTINHLIQLSKKCKTKIKTNIALAVGIKLVILATAAIGFTNLALAIFADVGVTVIVVINGLKLFNYKSIKK